GMKSLHLELGSPHGVKVRVEAEAGAKTETPRTQLTIVMASRIDVFLVQVIAPQ
ncbi:hypothetical protein HAX54_042363, partial [Datura stramonium]|nr:hypothetical protein [Datura stramonium]